MSQSQRQAVAQFRSVTNCSDASATKYMKSAKYNLDAALDTYYRKHAPARPAVVDTAQLDALFSTYADPATPDEITIDGTIRYVEDLGMSLDEPGVLSLAMLLASPTQGTFSRSGFVTGWSTLGITTLSAMRHHAARLTADLRAAATTDAQFKRTYCYTFTFGVTPPSRTMPLESALVYWDLLLDGKFPRLPAWKEFCLTRGKARGISRDVWNLVLEFTTAVQSLDDYDELEAWPVMIDEFVAWCREHDK